MHIEHLEAVSFRNLATLHLALSPHMVVLRGANAQGKTNLLEALYVCATGRSFRNAPPRELLRHHATTGSVRAVFSRHAVRHDVTVGLTPRGRHVRVDGRGLRQASRLLELVNVVAFFPDDLRITKGSPEERRRFMDRAIANHRPSFVDAAVSYARVIKQRNALLRAPRCDRSLLQVYDRQLVQHGSVLHAERQQFLAAIRPAVVQRFTQIMRTQISVAVELESGLPDTATSDPKTFATAFGASLEASYPRDRARGLTSVGPHRADLVLQIDAHEARSFASQGQQRALVLALKLAEVAYLTDKLGTAPILLLDDVSSELDVERTRMLFEAVTSLGSQVWVSTTGAAPLPVGPEAQIFAVHDGAVDPVA